MINFTIPKGHLMTKTLELLKRSGYSIVSNPRGYRPSINDPSISVKILRPQEIPIFVEEGSHDIGISGSDWINETDSEVEILLNLDYANVKVVLAVPETMRDIHNVDDLINHYHRKNIDLKISTEYLNLTKKVFMNNDTYKTLYGDEDPLIVTPWWKSGKNENIKIFLSFGATEAKPPEDANAIVEVVETGTSLSSNGLKIIEELYNSTAVFIANKASLKNPKKREKILDIMTLLKGVVDGKRKLHMFLNVCEENLLEVTKAIPSLKSPTISKLRDEGWYSLNTVIDRAIFLEILPKLRKLAQGLIIFEPRQVLLLEENSKLEEFSYG